MTLRRRKLLMLSMRSYLGVFILTLVIGLIAHPAFSQITAPVGKTEEQSSQLVLWYDQVFDPFGRVSFIQVTNASPDPVTVHVQIFRNFCTGALNADFQCPSNSFVRCDELNFDDFYTGFDSHIYDLSDIVKNDPLNPASIGDVDDTKGFIVITPVNNIAEREAISFQHMFGTSYIQDFNQDAEFILNAMGRDAVDFSTGSIVADETELDGVAAGYVVLQPDAVKFNFAVSYTAGEEVFDILSDPFADIVSIAFQDNYDATFGAYEAEAATATLNGFVFDEFENQISGCNVTQNCFSDVGLNNVIAPANPLIDGNFTLCAGNDFEAGWVRLQVSGLGDFTNEIGIVGILGDIPQFDGFQGVGGAKYMHVEGGGTIPLVPLQ